MAPTHRGETITGLVVVRIDARAGTATPSRWTTMEGAPGLDAFEYVQPGALHSLVRLPDGGVLIALQERRLGGSMVSAGIVAVTYATIQLGELLLVGIAADGSLQWSSVVERRLAENVTDWTGVPSMLDALTPAMRQRRDGVCELLFYDRRGLVMHELRTADGSTAGLRSGTVVETSSAVPELQHLVWLDDRTAIIPWLFIRGGPEVETRLVTVRLETAGS